MLIYWRVILETGFLAFQASLSGDSSDEEQRVAESKEAEEAEEAHRPATWSDDFTVPGTMAPPLVIEHNYGKSPFLKGKSTLNYHFDVNVGLDSPQ